MGCIFIIYKFPPYIKHTIMKRLAVFPFLLLVMNSGHAQYTRHYADGIYIDREEPLHKNPPVTDATVDRPAHTAPETPAAQNKVPADIPQKTIAQFRTTIADESQHQVYYITDKGKEGMFAFDGAGANKKEDEGVMTLVTANNKRYRRLVQDHINVKWFGARCDGATIAAVYSAQYGPNGFAEAKKLFDACNKNLQVPYEFDERLYNTKTMDWFALQMGINYCVGYSWESNADRERYKTLYAPAGVYTINKELFAQRFDGTDYKIVTFSLLGEAGYYNGTVIRTLDSTTFALGIQLGYHCKVENISFTGVFTPQFGALSDRAFYNASLASYKNLIRPGCADGQYAPYSAIVIDPFSLSPIPKDLPKGITTADYYSGLAGYYRGTRSFNQGGSTKIEINRVYIEKFVAGIVFSPNGITANNELAKLENISLRGLKIGIALSQAQEKTNVIKHLSAWNDVHTVIACNGAGYGAQAPGQWSIEDVDLAERINQFIFRKDNQYFPLFVRNFFSERLGSLGMLSSEVAGSFENGEIGFNLPMMLSKERGQEAYGGHMAKWQIEGGGYTFKNCNIRFYKNEGWPVSIAGNFKFENCVFETVPFFSQSHNYGQPLFVNCNTTLQGGFGITGIRSTTPGNFSKNVAYGSFILRDYLADKESNQQQFRYENHIPFQLVGEKKVVLASGANPQQNNGDIVIDLPKAWWENYYSFSKLVVMYDPANDPDNYVPLGLVKNYDAAAQKLTIGGVRSSIPATPVYIKCMLPVETINPFMGDLISGVNEIRNIRMDGGSSSAPNKVTSYGAIDPTSYKGKVILLNNVQANNTVYGNYAVIKEYDAANNKFLLSSAEGEMGTYATVKGVYFCNGCEKQKEMKGIHHKVSAGEVLQRGSRIILTEKSEDGLDREYRVVKTGTFNAAALSPAESRQAEMVPEFNYNNHADARFYGKADIFFKSVAEANTLVKNLDRRQGMNVLIQTGNSVAEYWYKDGIADADLVKKSSGGNDVAGKTTTTASSSAATAFTNAPDLAFNVSGGGNYKFKFVVIFSTAAATTGIRLGVNYASAAVNQFVANVLIPNGADGNGALLNGWLSGASNTDAVVSAGVQAVGTKYMAVVEGSCTAVAAATLQLVFSSEVNGSTVTVHPGSYVSFEKY
jgi:hypothetical protein